MRGYGIKYGMDRPVNPTLKMVLQELFGKTVANAGKMNMDPLAFGIFTLEQAQLTLESIRQAELVQEAAAVHSDGSEDLREALIHLLDKTDRRPLSQRKPAKTEFIDQGDLAGQHASKVKVVNKRQKSRIDASSDEDVQWIDKEFLTSGKKQITLFSGSFKTTVMINKALMSALALLKEPSGKQWVDKAIKKHFCSLPQTVKNKSGAIEDMLLEEWRKSSRMWMAPINPAFGEDQDSLNSPRH